MKFLLRLMSVAIVAVSTWCSTSMATLWVPGDHQSPTWDIENAPTMTEAPPASGKYSLSLSGLPVSKLEFKIVDDEGSPPPTWTDPQLTPGPNSWFIPDPAGNATISVDRNTYSDGFAPTTNRVSVSSDEAAIANFHAVGDWMTEAGLAGDWNPGDPAAAMTNISGRLFGLLVSISTPGSYQYKATKGDWDGQWGPDGRNENAGTWNFTTTEPGQQMRLLLDLGKGAISVQAVPEPASVALVGLALVAFCGATRRRK